MSKKKFIGTIGDIPVYEDNKVNQDEDVTVNIEEMNSIKELSRKLENKESVEWDDINRNLKTTREAIKIIFRQDYKYSPEFNMAVNKSFDIFEGLIIDKIKKLEKRKKDNEKDPGIDEWAREMVKNQINGAINVLKEVSGC